MAVCAFMVQAQVITAPVIQCITNDNTSGDITIQWANPPANACGPFVQYTIYASSTGAAGPYNPVAITNQASTSQLLTNYLSISQTWHFYMEANYNCPGATVLQSDTVDNLNPATPVIIKVDIVNGRPVFSWKPSTSPQTFGYVVYYYLANGNALPLDTVYGRFNTTYTDMVGDPTSEALYYTVSAFDSCWRFSAFNILPHNTIKTSATSTACESEVRVSWNSYINWPQGVKEYQIWASANAGALTQVGTVDSATLNFSYTNFIDGDSLCITVRAISAADTNIVSNSISYCLIAAIIQPPKYLYITNATVSMDNYISITWMVDTLAELIFYKIDQSTNNNSYTLAKQIPVTSTIPHFQTWTDSSALLTTKLNPYYYKVTAIDSCQHTFVSQSVKTINLQGELYDYYVAHLEWNNFELEHATVTHYNIYRNYGPGYQLIATQPATADPNEYSDSLQQFLSERGFFCYYVEAVYNINLPNGYTATLSSFSNEQCIIHRPIIYIPTAFAPNGLNNIFKPTIIYGEPQGYTMSIFNRWGAKIFESNDPAIGWDGRDGTGKPAQAGGYAYLIQFTAADETQVERKGMVLLVK